MAELWRYAIWQNYEDKLIWQNYEDMRYGRTMKISEYGRTMKIREYGRTMKINEYSRTMKISEYSRTMKICEYGRTMKIREYIRTMKTSEYCRSMKICKYGRTVNLWERFVAFLCYIVFCKLFERGRTVQLCVCTAVLVWQNCEAVRVYSRACVAELWGCACAQPCLCGRTVRLCQCFVPFMCYIGFCRQKTGINISHLLHHLKINISNLLHQPIHSN